MLGTLLYFSYLLRNTEQRLWNLVDLWIQEIDRDFDHILILEEVDDSLAVLMLKFCWDIDDVVHLKLNAMSSKSKEINAEAKSNLKKLNWADYRLYNYFKNKLHKESKFFFYLRIPLTIGNMARKKSINYFLS